MEDGYYNNNKVRVPQETSKGMPEDFGYDIVALLSLIFTGESLISPVDGQDLVGRD